MLAASHESINQQLLLSFKFMVGKVKNVRINVTFVTARTRIGRVKFKECGELLTSKRTRLRLKEWFIGVV